MRNTPLKAFAKKSPIEQNESISDSTHRGNVREVKVLSKEEITANNRKTADKGQQGGSGIVYSKSDEQLKHIKRSNPLTTLIFGRS